MFLPIFRNLYFYCLNALTLSENKKETTKECEKAPIFYQFTLE